MQKKLLYCATLCLLLSHAGYSYLNQEDAEYRTQQMVADLFKWQSQNHEVKQKLQDFTQDFCKATFSNDVSYGQFTDENVAHMVIDQAAEKIVDWTNGLVVKQVMADANLRQQFTATNQKHLNPLRKAVAHAIRQQVKRTTAKPLNMVQTGEFQNFIGDALRAKVNEQIYQIANRQCAVYCGDDAHNEILLNCGHKLHPSCLQSIIDATGVARAQCPLCKEKLREYANQAQPAQPVWQPTSRPQPSAPPLHPEPQQNNRGWFFGFRW